MFTHAAIRQELDRLLKEAEAMEAANKVAGNHGRGSPMVDFIVSLTRVVAKMADAQRVGF